MKQDADLKVILTLTGDLPPWNQTQARGWTTKWEATPTEISQEVESHLAYHPYMAAPAIPHLLPNDLFDVKDLLTCCTARDPAALRRCCTAKDHKQARDWFITARYFYTKRGITLAWFDKNSRHSTFLSEIGSFVVQITEDVVEYHGTREAITIYRANDLIVTINGRVVVLVGGKSDKAILLHNKNKTTTTPPTLKQLGLNNSYDLLRSLTFIPASLQIFEKIQLNHRLKVHQQGKRIEEGRLEVTTHNQRLTYNY